MCILFIRNKSYWEKKFTQNPNIEKKNSHRIRNWWQYTYDFTNNTAEDILFYHWQIWTYVPCFTIKHDIHDIALHGTQMPRTDEYSPTNAPRERTWPYGTNIWKKMAALHFNLYSIGFDSFIYDSVFQIYNRNISLVTVIHMNNFEMSFKPLNKKFV